MSRAQIALAWLRRSPVVAAPIVGALAIEHIDDAIAALAIALTDDGGQAGGAPYAASRQPGSIRSGRARP